MRAKPSIVLVLMMAGGAVLSHASAQNLSGQSITASGPSAFKLGEFAAFERKTPPQPMPDVTFQNASGENLSFASLKGRGIVLNIWATWCGPCRQEMPALSRLQRAIAGTGVEVVALSVDSKGFKAAESFLRGVKAADLKLFADPSTRARSALAISGLPTTLLIDKDGLEVGRLSGAAHWDSEEAKQLIATLIKPTN